MRFFRAFVFLLAFAAAPGAAFANPLVRDANITDGAAYELSPFSLVITFARSVTLAEVFMIDQDGARIAAPVGPRRAATHNVALPVLPPHGYRLYWRGADGRTPISGSIGFTITGCDDPAQVPQGQAQGRSAR